VVGIPAFNEEKTSARVVIEAQEYADKVVVCDDGSTDYTAKIAERLGADVIKHGKNLGYGAAIQSLFKHAKKLDADILVTLDADGQHNPREIPSLMKPVLEGKANVVIGSRFLRDRRTSATEIPWHRRVGIGTVTRLTNAASSHGVRDAQSGFRAYDRKALENLKLYENGMGVSVEVLMEADKNSLIVVETSVGCNYRGLDRTSTHNPLRHGASVVTCIVRLVVEERPLMFLGVPGAISLLIGVLFGAWMLQKYATERHIITNIALASMAFTLIGSFSVSAAITLYAIKRLLQKIAK